MDYGTYAVLVSSVMLSLFVCVCCFRESCDALMHSSCLADIEKVSFLNCSSLPSQNSSQSCSVVELKNATSETITLLCLHISGFAYQFNCNFERRFVIGVIK